MEGVYSRDERSQNQGGLGSEAREGGGGEGRELRQTRAFSSASRVQGGGARNRELW